MAISYRILEDGGIPIEWHIWQRSIHLRRQNESNLLCLGVLKSYKRVPWERDDISKPEPGTVE